MSKKNALIAATLSLSAFPLADGAIICKADDSKGACQNAQYCCYSGSEAEGDKFCRNLGCSRGGTSSSCPTAGNRKTCGADPKGATAHERLKAGATTVAQKAKSTTTRRLF